MKKRSFVEEMTAFISNMRVEKSTSSVKPESELLKWFKENLKGFSLGTKAHPESGETENYVYAGISLYITPIEGVTQFLDALTDMPSELLEEFEANSSIQLSIKSYKIAGVEKNVHWDFTVDWNFTEGQDDSTRPIAVLQPSEIDYDVVSFLGTCTYESYEGDVALLNIINDIFTAENLEVVGEFKLAGGSIDLTLGASGN